MMPKHHVDEEADPGQRGHCICSGHAIHTKRHECRHRRSMQTAIPASHHSVPHQDAHGVKEEATTSVVKSDPTLTSDANSVQDVYNTHTLDTYGVKEEAVHRALESCHPAAACCS